MAMDTDDNLYPIAVLIDELKNDDMRLRLNSVGRLDTIAAALGDERTRKELIPFLAESTDDDDEVLLAMAEQLGNLVPHVGGPAHAMVLLGPLESLCKVEETVVRDKASESVAKVIEQLQEDAVVMHALPFLTRLSSGDWFTSRVSAAALIKVVHVRVSAQMQADLRQTFANLCGDETPMVRRAAAKHMGSFVQVCTADIVKDEIVPLFLRLSEDDQDSVRLLIVETLAPLAKGLSRETVQTELTQTFRKFVADRSWRVRYMVSQQLFQLCEALGTECSKVEIVPALTRLLSDTEAEVRVASVAQIAKVGEFSNFFPLMNRV